MARRSAGAVAADVPDAARAPAPLARRFEAVICDWDGTAVSDRHADASPLRALIEDASALGLHVAVVSGTNAQNIDGQLAARPRGPGSLHLLVNRGSEVYRLGSAGPRLVLRRRATKAEEAALTRAAELVAAELRAHGLDVEIVSNRLNRRKVDLIPEPAWADPPKERIGELVAEVEKRLAQHGVGGLDTVVALAERCAREAGLPDPRVTSDAKNVEIGLTDKSDSARWIAGELLRRGIGSSLALIAGDEFGSLGARLGSDALLLVPELARATAVSVGPEPTAVPDGVLHLGNGPPAFRRILADQLERRRRGDVPGLDEDPSWILSVDGFDPDLERVRESLFSLADGRLGTRGSLPVHHEASRPLVLAAGLYDGYGPAEELLPCPLWARLGAEVSGEPVARRILDLRAGLLRQELRLESGAVESLVFSSFARPGVTVARAVGTRRALSASVP
ncbi:MAG: hypothetical protein ACXVRU_07555, partial [Gaiellaceae bacterium]